MSKIPLYLVLLLHQ